MAGGAGPQAAGFKGVALEIQPLLGGRGCPTATVLQCEFDECDTSWEETHPLIYFYLNLKNKVQTPRGRRHELPCPVRGSGLRLRGAEGSQTRVPLVPPVLPQDAGQTTAGNDFHGPSGGLCPPTPALSRKPGMLAAHLLGHQLPSWSLPGSRARIQGSPQPILVGRSR